MEFKKQIVFAYKSLKANRLCSVIGMVGLGIGLACTLVIVKYVWQEYTTDRFHRNYKRIYCCTSRASDLSTPGLSEVLDSRKKKTVYPEIEAHTAVGLFDDEPLLVAEKAYDAKVGITTTSFFRVFDLNLIAGDMATVLRQETDMVITRRLARKLFGQEDPLGKEVIFWDKAYRITGILQDLPVNSTLDFDVLILDRGNFSRAKAEFVLLKENCDIRKVNERINQEETWIYPPLTYEYIPFEGIYFNPRVKLDLLHSAEKGNFRFLLILVFAALLILCVSLINYVNIYQVALLRRDQELGVKRVHGMDNGNLWTALWLENGILVTGAVVLAVGGMFALAAVIRNELGVPLHMNAGFDVLLLALMLLVLPVATSVWPYLKFKNLHPAMAMKSTGTTRKSTALRSVLLMMQFVMTLVMLIVAFYFIRQLHFMLNKDIGVKKENILSAELFKPLRLENSWDDDEKIREAKRARYETISRKYGQEIQYVKNEIGKFPFIQNACSTCSPLEVQPNEWKAANSDKDYIDCPVLAVVPEFKELYGIKLKEGRFFDAGKDKPRGPVVVINETARKCFGINNLEEDFLVNKYWSVFNNAFRIIGVVEDFRFTHLSTSVQPLVMVYFGDTEGVPYQMQVTPGKEQETIAFLRRLYERLDPNQVMKYHFFEEEIDRLYARDKKTVRIATIFTFFAVCISAFGLFGFAYFDARQRYREIGIRKVNGATIAEVIWLLVRRFLILVVLAFVIAFPFAWWIIRQYQENFVEAAPASWWIFAGALLTTVAVALITLFRQSRKAAATNPVEALKNE